MNLIDSYEKFCRAFKGNPDEVNNAELLLLLQDWIIRIIDRIDEGSTDYSLDSLISENTDKSYLRYAKKDAVSRLIDDSYDAVRRISDRMRENIIRENVKMPVYKVREVNSYGLNWLSRRPGTTIKEKISSSNSSMMAVQRRMSLDTGENRLFIAYLKELADALEIKLENFPERQQNELESGFYSQLFAIVRDPDNEEIRRWENMPPNNTLLSDQNYKKIWKCWNELKAIDTIIANDSINIDSRVCTMFFIELLTKANQFFWFPQIPIDVDYSSYKVKLYAKSFRGIDFEGNTLSIKKTQNTIEIIYRTRTVNVRFEDANIQISVNGKDEHAVKANISSINRYVDLVLAKFGCKKTGMQRPVEKATLEKSSVLLMDLFSVRPNYISDYGNIESLKGRILSQTHLWEDEEGNYKFEISCDTSNALLFDENIETYTVATAVEQASANQMTKLMHLLERYVSAQKFTFLFPDLYNEFQLSLVYKAARLIFHEVRSFPRSIGVAFSYMDTISFQKQFKENDFLLVMDVIDTDLSLTLIQGIKDDTVAEDIPQYGGIIWERHPSLSYSLENSIRDEIYDRLLKLGCNNPEELYSWLGINGFYSESGLLATMSQGEKAFIISDTVFDAFKATKINVSDSINDFLINHKEIIGNNHVHIVSISPLLLYKGTCSYETLGLDSSLEGCKRYGVLQAQSKITLWRDHLPELAIKLLYGKFNLVDNETITPEFNVEKKIRISNVFTLAKGMSEYHFNLVQNDVNRKTRYAAVVKNPAFPINHDVQCKLDMTYQYGAEEPYRLLFIPLEKDAGFVEAKVSWEKVKIQPFMDLEYPDAITSLPWDSMRDFSGRNGKVDLITEMTNKLYAIGKGFQTLALSDFDISYKGEKGKRSFSLEAIYDDQPINIIFVETNMDKQKFGRQISFDNLDLISFDMNEANSRGKQRYFADLSACFGYRTIWVDKGHGYASYPYLNIDGKSVKVAFFENQFDHPEEFHTGITNVSFEVVPYNDIFKAIKIHDESSGETYQEVKNYFAINIRKGRTPGQFTYNGWVYFMMLSMFVGKNSFYDEECPEELREAFEFARDTWIDSFKNCDDEFVKMRMFNLMSLVANDIGSSYFDIAGEYLEDYMRNEGKLPDYIGYALADCTSESEINLFYQIVGLKNEKAVCILSKAIWGNEDFIWNVPIANTLKYFEEAIKYIKKLCAGVNPNGKDITMCLEYILGALRLRKYNDSDLNYKLSMNNPLVRELYDLIEQIIDRKIEIYSFLKLDVQNKGVYDAVPDLLYALLVYISGEKGAGDIKISGLDLKDIEV